MGQAIWTGQLAGLKRGEVEVNRGWVEKALVDLLVRKGVVVDDVVRDFNAAVRDRVVITPFYLLHHCYTAQPVPWKYMLRAARTHLESKGIWKPRGPWFENGPFLLAALTKRFLPQVGVGKKAADAYGLYCDMVGAAEKDMDRFSLMT